MWHRKSIISKEPHLFDCIPWNAFARTKKPLPANAVCINNDKSIQRIKERAIKVGYKFVLDLIKKEPFGKRKIRDIKVSDAKLWFKKLHKDGRGYSTITSVRGVIKPAFQMACEEDAVRKNPFCFKLTDVVPNDSKRRIALTEEQQRLWMGFIRADKTYSKYYDEFAVLLGTGMRVSEFCGLTKADLDFKQWRIRVDHQLVRETNGRYYVEKTKTAAGCRYIPINSYGALYKKMIKVLMVCHGNICGKAQKSEDFNGFWALHNRF